MEDRGLVHPGSRPTRQPNQLSNALGGRPAQPLNNKSSHGLTYSGGRAIVHGTETCSAHAVRGGVCRIALTPITPITSITPITPSPPKRPVLRFGQLTHPALTLARSLPSPTPSIERHHRLENQMLFDCTF